MKKIIGTKQDTRHIRKTKMSDINPTILIIKINLNVLNNTIKGHT